MTKKKTDWWEIMVTAIEYIIAIAFVVFTLSLIIGSIIKTQF
jgi:hypothetical protein